jgi:acyl dehydratase
MSTVHFDGLASFVGNEIGVSDWLVIDQARLDMFAKATGDGQWIHVDVARAAKELPGGKTIAHGFLTLSLIPGLTDGLLAVEGVSRSINYGLNKVRVTNMVPVGSRVRARQKLLSVEPRAGVLQVVNQITIEIEGEKRPACVAETVSLLYP